MPAVETINGQAIVLHVKHKDKRDQAVEGLPFSVCPFEYSMAQPAAALLRWRTTAWTPIKDIQIRVVATGRKWSPTSVAGNLDWLPFPDPFTNGSVWEKVGFIHLLTKISGGSPVLAFACSQPLRTENPNTYGALFRAISDATSTPIRPKNRKEIAGAIAPRNSLTSPWALIEQVLTVRFADEPGNIHR